MSEITTDSRISVYYFYNFKNNLKKEQIRKIEPRTNEEGAYRVLTKSLVNFVLRKEVINPVPENL